MKERRLQDQYGRLVCTLTKAEAISLQNQGRIVKTGRTSYTLLVDPDPRDSPGTAAALSSDDMQMFAFRRWEDGALHRTQKERFIGHGLLPMPKKIDREERSLLRAVYTNFPSAPASA